jgi:hypothetical protein
MRTLYVTSIGTDDGVWARIAWTPEDADTNEKFLILDHVAREVRSRIEYKELEPNGSAEMTALLKEIAEMPDAELEILAKSSSYEKARDFQQYMFCEYDSFYYPHLITLSFEVE